MGIGHAVEQGYSATGVAHGLFHVEELAGRGDGLCFLLDWRSVITKDILVSCYILIHNLWKKRKEDHFGCSPVEKLKLTWDAFR